MDNHGIREILINALRQVFPKGLTVDHLTGLHPLGVAKGRGAVKTSLRRSVEIGKITLCDDGTYKANEAYERPLVVNDNEALALRSFDHYPVATMDTIAKFFTGTKDYTPRAFIAVQRAITRLIKRGKVERVSRGVYRRVGEKTKPQTAVHTNTPKPAYRAPGTLQAEILSLLTSSGKTLSAMDLVPVVTPVFKNPVVCCIAITQDLKKLVGLGLVDKLGPGKYRLSATKDSTPTP